MCNPWPLYYNSRMTAGILKLIIAIDHYSNHLMTLYSDARTPNAQCNKFQTIPSSTSQLSGACDCQSGRVLYTEHHISVFWLYTCESSFTCFFHRWDSYILINFSIPLSTTFLSQRMPYRRINGRKLINVEE